MNGPPANLTSPTRLIRTRHSGEEGPRTAGWFELYKDAKGKFRFRLKASSGEIIAVAEAYESKASSKKGFESVQKNTAVAVVVDLTE